MAFINNNGGMMWKPQTGKPGGGILVKPPSSTGNSGGYSLEAKKPQGSGGSSVMKPPSGSAGTGSGYSEEARPGGAGKEITIPPVSVPTAPTQGSTPKAPGMDDLGNVDYSQKWDSALSGGASYDELERIYNDRQNKIGGGGAYGQFTGDAKSQEMKSYLDRMKSEQDRQDAEDYIRAMNEARQKQALADLRAAYEKNVAGLDRAQAAIAPGYQNARNDAAGQAELQKKNFAEYAAANGLNSGAGGQAQLAFGNALQNNLSDISQKEASTQADLELQRSQMETDFNNAIASAKAQGNYELAQQLYAEKVRQNEQYLQQMQFQAQQDLQKEQLAWNKEQANIANGQWDKSFGADSAQNGKAWALKMAQEMAQYGNFDGYKALGYSDTEIQSMKDYWSWLQQQSTKTASKGGSGGGGTTSGALSAKDALAQFNNGYDTPEIRAAIGPVYGNVWGEAAPSISSYSQLGAVAQGIMNGAAHGYGGSGSIADQVERSLKSGAITQAEADFILKSIGY